MTEINDKEGKPLDMKQAFQELIDGAAAFRHYNPVQCNICKGTGKFGLIKKDEDESCFACKGKGTKEPFYPRLITKMEWPKELHRYEAVTSDTKCGDWVAVRSCDEKHGNKTYLGIFLGDLAISMQAHAIPGGEGCGDTLEMQPHRNPAMYVPDLKEIIWGCGSWWGEIESPEDLKQITNADINNIWYVRALKELSEKKETSCQDHSSGKPAEDCDSSTAPSLASPTL